MVGGPSMKGDILEKITEKNKVFEESSESSNDVPSERNHKVLNGKHTSVG